MKPWIVLVGGFLGAGKSTLLLAAAKELKRRALRSALILNDQGEDLVDTASALLQGIQHGEVTGGCFCCRFSQLTEVIDELLVRAPDVIFAEPVGSCTDISATTLLPLLEAGRYRVAPFTVLVDPFRAQILLKDGADADLAFLFRKQIEEADLVCFTKSDLCRELPLAFPTARQLSARNGQGVAAWIDEVLYGELRCGSAILDIDYERYAQAEAALAWLNARVKMQPRAPVSPAMMLGPFLSRLDADFTAAGIATVHLKAIIQAETGFVKAAICGNGQEPSVEGMLSASPAHSHDLLLNLRAAGPAGLVRSIVDRNLNSIDGVSSMMISCFHPAPPRPERRVTRQ